MFFPSEQVQQVVAALAHSEHLNEKLFQELERLLDFDDVKLSALFAVRYQFCWFFSRLLTSSQ